MVSWGALASFAGLALLIVLVPGPSVLFTIGRALTAGRRTALLNVVGNAVGVYLQIVAVACGVGAVVMASATAFTAIKLVGAGYLVYLGIQSFRHRTQLHGALQIGPEGRDGNTVAALRDGFIVGLANPKTIVIFAALLPQFVDPARGGAPQQMLILGLCIPVFGLVFDSLWALAAGSARTWFARSPRRLAAVGGTGGLVMIGLGASLALTGRKD
ncbi:LysE family translocator [Nocardia sp. GTS18]|uniref:LysE family translocator n=1 Tax=Nocardia sp. GTS18 TaxID=1778064 RepID=UPI0015EF38C2|nr:LysE family translocator [Nocardia sp. GTS18]